MLRSECETAQLIHCAETGDAANLRRLLTHYGLTRDYSQIPYSRTVLHRACIAGQRECVVELLKAGADSNEVDDNASTPLHLTINVPEADIDSVENDDTVRVVETLLQAGAKVDAADHWGETRAAKGHSFECSALFRRRRVETGGRVAREYVSKASFSGSGDTLKALG